ncbi:hypothetical protein AALO_G00147090 [Alosa alosa]|uniref:Uncharacterized protein n=1 Tax=Alosa alosa TaxID=278164 RepID=A0AAV6GD37_9TELE|nr:hypothetical protein AALO_G00147090 [Alosa alosa]
MKARHKQLTMNEQCWRVLHVLLALPELSEHPGMGDPSGRWFPQTPHGWNAVFKGHTGSVICYHSMAFICLVRRTLVQT